MPRKPVTQHEVVEQLRALGVGRRRVLLVHTSFRKTGPVEGGPEGLIASLREAIGDDGTLVMPSMNYEDDVAFDVATSPCPEMGIVAETFWRMPGVLRSDSPHAFAAIGPHAKTITKDHPVDLPHGLDSPVGRVYELDGQVLLLGVDHDADTTIHLAENMAGVRYRRPKHVTVRQDGEGRRFDYGEIDHCCENFTWVGHWLTELGQQKRGPVGHGEALLADSRDIVGVVVERLRAEETLFLHPVGVDEECDEARASIPV